MIGYLRNQEILTFLSDLAESVYFDNLEAYLHLENKCPTVSDDSPKKEHKGDEQFSYETSDDLSREYYLRLCTEKFAS